MKKIWGMFSYSNKPIFVKIKGINCDLDIFLFIALFITLKFDDFLKSASNLIF